MPKKTSIYIGLFEDFNKSFISVQQEDKLIVDSKVCRPIDLAVSTELAWSNIISFIQNVLEEYHLSLFDKDINFHLGLGLRTTEILTSSNEIEKNNSEKKIFASIEIRSDCYALCVAKKPNTAVIIVDSGVVGNLITQDDVLRAGGWGRPYGDIGGLLWMGEELIRYTILYHDGYIESTPLIHEVLNTKKFNNDIVALIGWAKNAYVNKDPEYIIFSEMVLTFLEKQDPIAIEIVKKTANEIEKIYRQLCKQSEQVDLPLYLYGRLAKSAATYLQMNNNYKGILEHEYSLGTLKLAKIASKQ